MLLIKYASIIHAYAIFPMISICFAFKFDCKCSPLKRGCLRQNGVDCSITIYGLVTPYTVQRSESTLSQVVAWGLMLPKIHTSYSLDILLTFHDMKYISKWYFQNNELFPQWRAVNDRGRHWFMKWIATRRHQAIPCAHFYQTEPFS